MSRTRQIEALVLFSTLVTYRAEAQVNLNKLKKAADTALDVKDEVDRFSFSEEEEIELGFAISDRIRAHEYGPGLTLHAKLLAFSREAAQSFLTLRQHRPYHAEQLDYTRGS